MRDRRALLLLLWLPGAAGAEPGWVGAFVESGQLPPLEVRLPSVPVVAKGAEAPPAGQAPWGDTLRIAVAGEPEGWNLWAGQDGGGIEGLLLGCLGRREGGAVVPDAAEGWEALGDGLLVRLREGLRWSDGDQVGAEDVALAARLSGGPAVAVTGPLELRVEGGEEALLALCPAPSHVGAVARGEPIAPGVLGLPVLGPWVVADHWAEDMVVLRRNPYFRMVDAEGRQLPYLDEVQVFLNVADPEAFAREGGVDWPGAGPRLRGGPEPERLWVPEGEREDFELHPGTLPGAFGAAGPVEAGGPLAKPGAP